MQGDRNLSLDIVKIVAMIGVICLHSTYSYSIPNQFCFADILYESAVVSMPLFFMVSGYLLIGRPNVDYRYSIRKIAKIIQFVSTIVIIYWFIYSVHHLQFDFYELAKSLVQPYFQRSRFYMFWYFGAMIILYMLYPILNTMFNRKPHWFFIITGVALLFSYTMFIGNLLVGGVMDTFEKEPTICQTFRVWISVSYFMIGGLLRKVPRLRYLGIMLVLLFALNIAIEEWLCRYIGNDHCEFFYGSVYVQLLSVFTFLFILNIKIKHSKLVSELSCLFLPVYTIHSFVISFVSRILHSYDYWFMPLVSWLLVSIISIAVSFMIMKIPYVNKIFRL